MMPYFKNKRGAAMKRILLLLIAVLFLHGCSTVSKSNGSIEQHSRSGKFLQGISQIQNGFECTETGVYFMRKNFLYYCDHDSNVLVKLCGRPDCKHSDASCNASFPLASNICYYNGALYTVQNMSLIRFDLDGSNRQIILDANDVDGEYIRGNSFSPQIWNGLFTIGLVYLDDSGAECVQYYYYPLDGSEEYMKPIDNMGLPMQNDGNAFITQGISPVSEDGVGIYLWEPAENINTYLTDYQGYGYYGAEKAFYLRDGVLIEKEYSTGCETQLVNTGFKGDPLLHCFPDYLVVSLSSDCASKILYFYNWNYELVDSIELSYENAENLYNPICGESDNRVYLLGGKSNLPEYYIDKADIGTGEIRLHRLTMP